MKRPRQQTTSEEHDRFEERRRFVHTQIRGRGITDPRVVDAMLAVPRHCFVAHELSDVAYEDRPLPIGLGQTISQPYIVAMMAEAAMIGPEDRVLEVGTGSGYGAAVLSRLASSVVTVERHRFLARAAADRLAALAGTNVQVVTGDGTLGWPDGAPYDAIVATAAGPTVPDALRRQLDDGGRLIMPVGKPGGDQRLLRIVRSGDHYSTEDLGGVRFVPLIGEQGVGEEATDEPGGDEVETR